MREPERLEARDLLDIEAQDSQVMWLGQSAEVDYESAAHLADQAIAWCARRDDGSILACVGINETFPGKQGVAWALLSSPIGEDHLPLTRFMRRQIDDCGLERVELIAKCAEAELFTVDIDGYEMQLQGDALCKAVMADPTPECRLAQMLTFEPAHVMRKLGFASESYMLFERFPMEKC